MYNIVPILLHIHVDVDDAPSGLWPSWGPASLKVHVPVDKE